MVKGLLGVATRPCWQPFCGLAGRPLRTFPGRLLVASATNFVAFVAAVVAFAAGLCGFVGGPFVTHPGSSFVALPAELLAFMARLHGREARRNALPYLNLDKQTSEARAHLDAVAHLKYGIVPMLL